MSNHANEILELINTSDKAASDMTKALKSIGGGDMQKGINRIADYFMKVGNQTGFIQGAKIGEKKGLLKGSVSTLSILALVAGGIYLKDKYEEYKHQKALEQEGQTILSTMQETIQKVDGDVGIEPNDNGELPIIMN